MSYADAVARIAQLQSLVAQAAPAPVQALPSQPALPAPTTTASSYPTTFSGVLGRTLQASGATPAAVLAAAEQEVGVSEQPPGSNDGPRIAQYRSAVAGAVPGGRWCAYFVSWAAAQAGLPLGDEGQGFGSVAELTRWASASGRLLPADAQPQPGDLILFGDRHVGVVESAAPDGTLTTIEGNHSDRVDRVTRSPGEATGFVRLG